MACVSKMRAWPSIIARVRVDNLRAKYKRFEHVLRQYWLSTMSSSESSFSSGCSSSTGITSSGEGSGSPVRKKRKLVAGGGRFRSSWDLPPYKYQRGSRNLPSASYATATLEYLNDVICHMNGWQRLKDAQSTTSIACVFSWSNADTSAKVISADVMSQFIAMHNLPFQTALRSCFSHVSDSKIVFL